LDAALSTFYSIPYIMLDEIHESMEKVVSNLDARSYTLVEAFSLFVNHFH
jgi:hypothetical protein